MIKKILIRTAALAMALCTALTLAACSADGNSDAAVLRAGDTDVPYSVLRYFIINYKSEYDALNDDFWDGSEEKTALAENIMSYSLESVREMYAVFTLAKEHGIDPFSDVMQTMLDTEFEKEKAAYGSDKEFDNYLKENGLTENSSRLLMLSKLCADEIYYAMKSNGEISSDKDYIRSVVESDEFIRVQHILVVPKSVSEEDMSTAKAKAEEARNKAASGEDFFSLVKEYGEDTYMFGNSDGYYIMRGVWQDEFENAAFSLNVGEISDVFYTSSGYSVLKRLEKESDYIEDNLDRLCDDYADAIYNRAIDQCANALDLTETEAFASISVPEVK